jgi:hypothetical protein
MVQSFCIGTYIRAGLTTEGKGLLAVDGWALCKDDVELRVQCHHGIAPLSQYLSWRTPLMSILRMTRICSAVGRSAER